MVRSGLSLGAEILDSIFNEKDTNNISVNDLDLCAL